MRQWRFVRLGALAALALLLAISTLQIRSLRHEDREFEALRARAATWGGSASRSPNHANPLLAVQALAPGWIAPFVGSDGYIVSAFGLDPGREQLAELLALRPIRSLSIAAVPRFSDDFVLGLSHPVAMLGLHLNDVGVSDRSVEAIAKMVDLNTLSLVGTSVSDEAVERLATLPKLGGLYVGGPNLRQVRLVDAEALDQSGGPAVAGRPVRLRGRIALGPRFGKPGNVLVMIREAGDPPPWMSHPYGWNASRRFATLLAHPTPGLGSFDLIMAPLPAGRTTVELWVDRLAPARPVFVHFRLPPFAVEVHEAGAGAGAVAEPGPSRQDETTRGDKLAPRPNS